MKRALLKLHLAVLIAGTSGLFGKLVTLNQFPLSLYRATFAAIILSIIMLCKKAVKDVPLLDAIKMAGVGMILAIHWIFFYGSIKYSNVSIGVVCFSLTGFFTAVLEPILMRKRFSVMELLFSVLTIIGIGLIFHFDTRYRTGILLGIVSSALHSWFTVANKMTAKSTGQPSSILLLISLIGGSVILITLIPFYSWTEPAMRLLPTLSDFLWLLALASITTILLYLLQIQALKEISAFTVSLSFNMEPIYSIIFAMILFNESKELNFAFYCGLALIILSVACQTLSVMRQRQTSKC